MLNRPRTIILIKGGNELILLGSELNSYYVGNKNYADGNNLPIFALVAANVSDTDVSHMTLAAELSPDYDERTVLSAFRSFLSISGAVSVVFIGYVFFFPDNRQLDADNYPDFALTAGVAMALSIIASGAGTHSYIPHLQQANLDVPSFSLKRVADEFTDAYNVRAFRFLLLALLANAALQGVLASIAVYIMTFFFQFEGSQIGVGLSLGMAGGVTGALICSPIAQRIGSKRNGLILGFLLDGEP